MLSGRGQRCTNQKKSLTLVKPEAPSCVIHKQMSRQQTHLAFSLSSWEFQPPKRCRSAKRTAFFLEVVKMILLPLTGSQIWAQIKLPERPVSCVRALCGSLLINHNIASEQQFDGKTKGTFCVSFCLKLCHGINRKERERAFSIFAHIKQKLKQILLPTNKGNSSGITLCYDACGFFSKGLPRSDAAELTPSKRSWVGRPCALHLAHGA